MNSVLVEDQDNVAVAIHPIEKDAVVEYLAKNGDSCTLIATEHIPLYHKLSIRDIPSESEIIKYGECIGRAAGNIAAGEHVHTHNVANLS